MTTDPREILANRAAQAPSPQISRGSSSYFTTPTNSLDPNLFDGDYLLDAVRQWLLDTGYGFLNTHFQGAHSWATFWIAGSGITYQWSAARSPGDLDVLIGVKPRLFKQHNRSYSGVDDATIARLITTTMKTGLWPKTANQQIGEQRYEVTWFVNPGAEDIRDINPYAAYNVTTNRWTVRPPELPGDWGAQHFPAEWWAQIGREKRQIHEILTEFLGARQSWLHAANPGIRVNAAQQMQYAAVRAASWFDSIHGGRREAFSPTGQGYLDWHNFRWQAGKRNGVIPVLHALTELWDEAKKESETERYGHALASTEQALATASLLHQHLASLEMR